MRQPGTETPPGSVQGPAGPTWSKHLHPPSHCWQPPPPSPVGFFFLVPRSANRFPLAGVWEDLIFTPPAARMLILHNDQHREILKRVMIYFFFATRS